MNEQSIINYLLGECTMEERKAMEQWLDDDERHVASYQQTVRAWEWSRKLVDAPAPDVDDAWSRFIVLRGQVPQPKLRKLATSLRRIAASVLLVGIAVSVGYFATGNRAEALLGKSLAATDHTVKDTLADGTIITLNKHSTLRVDRTWLAQTRSVRMESGEAFFEVARDEHKPFEVHIGETKVVVLGTSFNIRRTGDITEVTVSTGKVSVTHGQQSADLTAKQRVRIHDKDPLFVADEIDDLLYQHYVNDRYVLRNTPLKKVAEFLANEYKAIILIADSQLETLPLTATLGKDPLPELLRIIAESLEIEVSHNNGIYTFHR